LATELADAKGKVRKVYRPEDVQTPLERLLGIPNARRHLKPGITLPALVQAG